MNRTLRTLFAATLVAAGTTSYSQQTRQEAVAASRAKPVDPKFMDATYKHPAPAAQRIVNEGLAKHPNVILFGLHATPPGHSRDVIIASNFGRIGKVADDDDMGVLTTGKSLIDVSKDGKHFENDMALHDKTGKIVGMVAIIFGYKEGADKSAMQKEAEQILAEVESRVPTVDVLFSGQRM